MKNWNNRHFTGVVLGILLLLAGPSLLAASNYDLVPSSRVIARVIPGMTIDDIIRKIYPEDEALWPEIKKKLIAINPYSFHQYSDQLVTGSRLVLVEIRRIIEKTVNDKRKVGYVVRKNGSVTAKDSNGDTFRLQVNSQIYEGDRISTSATANLFILLDDGAEIHLKEDSVIKISEYAISSGFDNNSSSILDLLRGGLRKLTGAIGGNALANYQLQTGLATIGIRGTEYVAKLCNADDCSQTVSRNDPNAKLHAVVLDGIITLTTDEDVQILMAIGEYGTASGKELVVLQDTPVPPGFLDKQESQRFNIDIPKQLKREQSSSTGSVWTWVIGILLLGLAL